MDTTRRAIERGDFAAGLARLTVFAERFLREGLAHQLRQTSPAGLTALASHLASHGITASLDELGLGVLVGAWKLARTETRLSDLLGVAVALPPTLAQQGDAGFVSLRNGFVHGRGQWDSRSRATLRDTFEETDELWKRVGTAWLKRIDPLAMELAAPEANPERLFWEAAREVVRLLRRSNWVPQIIASTGWGGAMLAAYLSRNLGPDPIRFIALDRRRRRINRRLQIEIDDAVSLNLAPLERVLACHGYNLTGRTAEEFESWLIGALGGGDEAGKRIDVRTAALFGLVGSGFEPHFVGWRSDRRIEEPWIIDRDASADKVW